MRLGLAVLVVISSVGCGASGALAASEQSQGVTRDVKLIRVEEPGGDNNRSRERPNKWCTVPDSSGSYDINLRIDGRDVATLSRVCLQFNETNGPNGDQHRLLNGKADVVETWTREWIDPSRIRGGVVDDIDLTQQFFDKDIPNSAIGQVGFETFIRQCRPPAGGTGATVEGHADIGDRSVLAHAANVGVLHIHFRGGDNC